MPGKLDALSVRVGSIEDALGDFGRALDDNTMITRGIARQMEQMPQLVEMVTTYAQVKTTGTVLTRTVKWAGGIAAAFAGMLGLAHLFGKSP